MVSTVKKWLLNSSFGIVLIGTGIFLLVAYIIYAVVAFALLIFGRPTAAIYGLAFAWSLVRSKRDDDEGVTVSIFKNKNVRKSNEMKKSA